MENDNRFNFLFNEAFEKIPRFFRFTKKRYKITRTIMIVCVALALPLTTIFYYTGRPDDTSPLVPVSTVGGILPLMTYDYSWLIAALVLAGIGALIGAWMAVAKIYETRAFRKASDLSNRIFLAERHKLEVDWQNWKMNNRDY